MKKERILGKTLILILIPVAAILLLSLFPFSGGRRALYTSAPLNEHWTLSQPATASTTSLELPTVLHDIPPHTPISISCSLPETSFDEPTLYFITEQQNVSIYINDRLIYDYHPSPKWFGQSPGSAVHLVSLFDYTSGDVLTITLTSPYSAFSGIIRQVWMGSKSSHILSIVKGDLLPLALSVFSILLGIILIFTHKKMALRKMRSTGALHLAFFSILSGLWIAAERKLLLLFFDDPIFMTNLALISLFSLPIPLLLFVRRVFHPERSRNLLYLCCAFFLFFISGTLLQIHNLMDYILLLPMFHVLAALTILYMIYAGIQEIRVGNKDIRTFFYGCLIFGIFIMVDVVLYYLAETPRMNTQSFFRLGMLLFIVFSSSSMGQNLLHMRDIHTKNRVLHSLAYTDALTRLKNRTSFDKTIQCLSPCLCSETSVTLIVLDINNLKIVNDTLGHTEGDRLLIEGARILRATLGKLGEIYRIGGDEFALIIRNTPISVINEAVAELFEKIDNYNEHAASFKISMAYGMDSYQKGKDKDLNSVFVRADKAMYRCKTNQKLIQVVGSVPIE